MQVRRGVVIGMLGIWLGLAGWSQESVDAQAQSVQQLDPARLDVPFVPTPQPVVDVMLRLADLEKDELLYDLGSGDGRIVITAATRYGVRGVGIDIDPQRIAESNANAQQAGVLDRVKFLQADLFEADFSDADAVTLYLLSSVNERLRPKLLEQLRPGTPVVSHSFSMGDWEPDKTVTIDGRDVYMWIIPARVAGAWTVNVDTPRGARQLVVNLDQEYQKVNGTAHIGDQQVSVESGRLTGDTIRFAITEFVDGKEVTQVFTGRVDGDSIQGFVDDRTSGGGRQSWAAQRAAAAAGRL